MSRMRPVELDEGDWSDDDDLGESTGDDGHAGHEAAAGTEPGGPAVGEEPLAPPGRRGRGRAGRSLGRARGRWLVAGGAAALVVGAFVVQGVVEARREAHVARFDDVPGVLAPLDTLPVLRADVEAPSENALTQVGAVVLLQRDGGVSTVRVEALDRSTGDTVWTQDVEVPPDLRALAQGDPEPYELDCRAAGTDVAACVVEPAVTRLGPGPPDLLVTLDAADGTVLDRRPLAADDWEVLGTSVLTLGPGEVRLDLPDPDDDAGSASGEATWTVEAHSATDAETAWVWTAPTALPYDPGLMGGARLETSGDHVLVTVPGHWWLLDAAGTLVREGAQDEDEWQSLARGGLPVSGTFERQTYDDGSVASIPEPGEWGLPSRFAVDDASVPDVTFTGTRDQVLQARDVRTGELWWEHATAGQEPLLLDGVVVVLDDARVLALDARTGAVRWSGPAGDEVTSLATDGRRVLALPGFGGLLRAFALEDGRVDWEGRLPGAPAQVRAVQGVLLATDQDGAAPTLVVPRRVAGDSAVPRP